MVVLAFVISNGAWAQYNQDAAATEIRLQQLETEIRNLTGRIEEQNYKIQQLQQQLERATGDLTLRVNDLEQGGGSSSLSSSTSSSVSGVGRASHYIARTQAGSLETPEGGEDSGDSSSYQWRSGAPGVQVSDFVAGTGDDTPAALYENAYGLMKNNQYAEAASGFEKFLSENSDHPLAGNAKYWLGETYYVRNQYEKAARVFAEAYQQYPKNAKAPDNLLKLGMSLKGLGKKEDACVALSQLKKEYATTAAPVVKRAEQEMTGLGC